MIASPLIERFKVLNRYRIAFSNYLSVIHARVFRNFPCEAILRTSGNNVVLFDQFSAFYISWYESLGWRYDIKENKVFVKTPLMNNEVIFYGGLTQGDLVGCFANGVYAKFEVSGKMVLDIGGSIADSAILFCLKGAKRVIALEPYPETALLARQNIIENGFDEKVEIINAGIGEKSEIKIPFYGTGQENLSDFGYRAIIPLYTIEEVVNKYGINNGVLKIDCEGCEYYAINESVNLSNFDLIQIEYHFGLKKIPLILKDKGFKVQIKKHSKNIGDIIATR